MSANHILVWNARGLNSRARRTAVRDVAEQQRASIICLQQRRRGSARTFDRRTLSTQQLLTSIQEEGVTPGSAQAFAAWGCSLPSSLNRH
jgi:exonuclease III